MVGQVFSAFLRKSVVFRLGILAGLIGILVGCGSGGGSSSTAGSEVIPEPVNQNPTAAISPPSGTSFNEGENIIFSGTGNDVEDGQLNDGALVWTSSIDGPIGNGPTLITSVLSPGDHDITLTATDSNGATHTTDPISIRIEPTRFLKMGFQTTGVPDASNAFDGDQNTAATITTSETEFIHFKAYIGGADTFLFCIKLGASTIGSSLAIEGLTSNDTWQPINDIDLSVDRTVTVKVPDAQVHKDADGYINLRAFLVNAQGSDAVSIYEFWCSDSFYAGSQTIGVDNADQAFDGNPSTAAAISSSSDNFLHFKTYLGWRDSITITLNVLLNSIGPGNYLSLYVEDIKSGNLEFIEDLSLITTAARAVSIQDAQNYVDEDGYINLRAYWIGLKPPGAAVDVYEIRRSDPFFVGHKTSFGWIASPESAVDGKLDSFATIYYFWGELDHKDFLHVKTYVGDASPITFSITSATSAPPEAELIIEGEYESDTWSVIEMISMDDVATKTINLANSRDYVDADGYLSLRLRWNSDSMSHDALIYEIEREEN